MIAERPKDHQFLCMHSLRQRGNGLTAPLSEIGAVRKRDGDATIARQWSSLSEAGDGSSNVPR